MYIYIYIYIYIHIYIAIHIYWVHPSTSHPFDTATPFGGWFVSCVCVCDMLIFSQGAGAILVVSCVWC